MIVVNGLAHAKNLAIRMADVHLADPQLSSLRWTEDLQVLALAAGIHGIYVIGPDCHPARRCRRDRPVRRDQAHDYRAVAWSFSRAAVQVKVSAGTGRAVWPTAPTAVTRQPLPVDQAR